jgi:2-dehydro-3-deoxyphosphogluconate aldolase/(4S)-4-hydroxy-2-oxoglutarate aldolase
VDHPLPFEEIAKHNPVIPVVTFSSFDHILPLANALMAGGIHIIEITLRSQLGLPAIELIVKELPEMTVGAGSVKDPQAFQSAIKAGAHFAVSPGTTHALLEEAVRWDVPFLPAASTASESLNLLQSGYACQKLFPANILGGIDFLKSLAGPIPEVSFCPSGGLNAENYRLYLQQPNVVCVSGSWIAPDALINAGDWNSVTGLARETCSETLSHVAP